MVKRISFGDECINGSEDANENLNPHDIKMSGVISRNSSSEEEDVIENLKSLSMVSNLSDEDAGNGENTPETKALYRCDAPES